MNGSERFCLDVRDSDEGPIVVLAGDIDLATVDELGACLEPLAGQRVTLDFGEVTFLDSTGIRVLVEAQHRAETDGGELVLRRVQPAQMRVLEITGLTQRFKFDGNTPSG